MDKFEIEIVNYFDMEEPVAEVYYSSFQWAKIFRKNKELRVQFYHNPDKRSWELPFKEALNTIEQAKDKLLKKLGTKSSFFSKGPIDPKKVNEQAQEILEKILNHPEKTVIGKLKDKCLNENIFETLSEARVILERWRKNYNGERQHSSLKGLTKEAYARQVHRTTNLAVVSL